jgi:hypothetical protein
MGFNIGAGLQALANAGTGFVQGQEQASQNDYTRQMQTLALQNAHQVADQNSQKAQWQQQEMDDMMKGSIAKPTPIINPQTGQPLGAPPPQPQPTPAQQQEQNDPGTFFSNLAASARSHGDLVGASEAYANLANIQSTQVKQQQEQSAMQTAELTRQEKHFGMTAQAASSLPDTPEGFQQLKMSVLSDPNSSPIERQNFAGLQYTPGIMQKIAQSGMTAAQQATQKMEQMRLANTEMHERIQEGQTAIRDANTNAYRSADLALRVNNKKAGAIDKAPSPEQLRDAMPIVAKRLGVNPTDTTNNPLYSVDATSSNAKSLHSPALTEIVSEANQIMFADPSRSITFSQAVDQAAQRAVANGTLVKPHDVQVPGRLWGTNTEQRPAEFTGEGNTPDKPIPLSASLHKDPALRIPGKIYEMINNKTKAKVAMKWTKEGWMQP